MKTIARCLMVPVLVFAAGIGCEANLAGPVSPAPSTDVGPSSPLGNGAQVINMEVILAQDNLVFVPCANDGLGEDVRFFGDVNFLVHGVITPSGISTLNVLLPPPPVAPPFFATGQDSGAEYVFVRGVGHNVFVTTRVGEIQHFSSVEDYVNVDTGDVMRLRAQFHLMVNPNHEVVVDHGGYTCE